jgi:hypothetical protein
MIRPVRFGFNKETASNNVFQSVDDSNAQELALKEFDDFVTLLVHHGIDVTVIDDTPDPFTPDSIFPNNWISFHDNASVVLYPMFAPNRRKERKPHILEALNKTFRVDRQIDMSSYENQNVFLEGTGSMVLDRIDKIVYACLSERTIRTALEDFCENLGYALVCFHATDESDYPIYHTNVMMCVADEYAVVCLDSIKEPKERQSVMDSLDKTFKEIIPISHAQMNHFAGNMLQVHNDQGQKYLIMSTQAFESLTVDETEAIQGYNPILHSSLLTIERNGGGSARCMMAEIFLPLK